MELAFFNFTQDFGIFELLLQDVLFPKMSKCNIQIYGPSGTLQRFDALCVLPLNILHDKVDIEGKDVT